MCLLYYDKFCETGEGMSMPSGVYDLDRIKKLGKPRNWCPYYLICRAINRQVVVVVDHDDDGGDVTCGGGYVVIGS